MSEKGVVTTTITIILNYYYSSLYQTVTNDFGEDTFFHNLYVSRQF